MEEQQSILPNQTKFKKLRRFNLIMFFLHLGQGIAMLIVASDFRLPVNTSFVEMNTVTLKLEAVLERLWELPIGPLVAGFLFLSALAHLLLTLPKINDWYNKNLAKGANYARWIEYFFSSSLMILIVCMLVGIYDLIALMGLFFLNGMMILFGLMMEMHNQTTQKTKWHSFWFGCLAGAIPWIAVALHLFNAGSGDAKAPSFVYWIFFSIFLFFNVFAINMVLQYKKVGKWSDYLYGERAYIILSLVAKSLLAWQVFAGTLRPV